MTLVLVCCERCGARMEITPGASATHASCPKREQRKPAPVYRKVTDDS